MEQLKTFVWDSELRERLEPAGKLLITIDQGSQIRIDNFFKIWDEEIK